MLAQSISASPPGLGRRSQICKMRGGRGREGYGECTNKITERGHETGKRSWRTPTNVVTRDWAGQRLAYQKDEECWKAGNGGGVRERGYVPWIEMWTSKAVSIPKKIMQCLP